MESRLMICLNNFVFFIGVEEDQPVFGRLIARTTTCICDTNYFYSALTQAGGRTLSRCRRHIVQNNMFVAQRGKIALGLDESTCLDSCAF
jgi:hypothetical protein